MPSSLFFCQFNINFIRRSNFNFDSNFNYIHVHVHTCRCIQNQFMKKVNSKEDLLLISNPNYKREIMQELKENSLNRIKTLCL